MATERKRFIVSIVAVHLGRSITMDYDWVAYYGEDELDEDRHRGYGRTAADAINNLTSKYRWEP